MDSLGELIGLGGDSFGYLENILRWRVSMILIKLVVALADITSESLTLYYATINRVTFNKNITVTVTYQNETHVSNVTLDKFNDSYISYTVFYSLNTIVVIFYLIYQISRIMKKKSATRFVSVIIAVVLEMPLLVAEVSMLKAQGVIDWHTQFWSLVTHVMFIFNLFLSATLDYFTMIETWTFKLSYYSIAVVVIIFGLACMAYTPVSTAMVGFKWGKKITFEDFGGIIVRENIKRVLLILMELGRVGQFLWSLVIIFTIFYVVKSLITD